MNHDRYCVPPIDTLDAAIIALGRMYDELLPDEELVAPTGFPPIEFDIGRVSERAPRWPSLDGI